MNMNINFGEAVEKLKEGYRVARQGWNGKGMWLELVLAQDFQSSEMLPFIAIKNVRNAFSPWQPSQEDMLSEDWVVVE